MTSYQGLLGKQTSNDEDEEEEEEESSDKSEEKEEGESKEDKSSDSDQRLNGRDKNGMYKNHKNYVNLRNKINEQESGHKEMFDSINDKLSDGNFIQSAAETSAKGPYDRTKNPFEQFR